MQYYMRIIWTSSKYVEYSTIGSENDFAYIEKLENRMISSSGKRGRVPEDKYLSPLYSDI